MNVLSFFAPRPDHKFYQDYTPYIDLLRASCTKYGHKHLVLTDDPSVGRDGDAYVAELPDNLMRAYLAAQYAYLSDPQYADTPTLLTGADCVLARDPEAFAQFGADLVITVCDEFTDCRINMGAIYVPRPAAVARLWLNALNRCLGDWGDDQRAFRDALAETTGVTVVELPVDPWNLAPNTPDDDCLRGYVLHFRGPRKRWMVSYCHQWLGIGDGVQITVASNTDANTAMLNIASALKRELPELREIDAHDGDAVIVGSGPSAADQLLFLRQVATRDNVTVFGLNGAVKWLMDNRVAVHYGVVLDMRAKNAEFVRGVDPAYGWLIASQCAPEVLDAASEVTLYHFADPDTARAMPFNATVVGGGLTVGLTTMAVAYAMGYRRLHLVGFDSSARADQTHLRPQEQTAVESQRIEVFHDGRTYVTTPAMLKQAEAFEPWCQTLMAAGVEVVVYGDGLLPSIAHSMVAPAAEAA